MTTKYEIGQKLYYLYALNSIKSATVTDVHIDSKGRINYRLDGNYYDEDGVSSDPDTILAAAHAIARRKYDKERAEIIEEYNRFIKQGEKTK